MTEDWASRLAMQIHGLTPEQESVVEQFLRDERSRADEKCRTAPIRDKALGRRGAAEISAWFAGTIDARRDIEAAIKGEAEQR